jgi:hypothetical protein
VEPSEPAPPPTPFEREVVGDARAIAAVGVAAQPPRRGRRLTLVAGVLLVGAVAVGGWLELRDEGWAEQRTAAGEQARDEALLTLFADIEQSEGTMLGFYDRLRDEFDPTLGTDEVRGVIAAAAVDAAATLREIRARIVPLADDAVVDDVRAAYLPHLDSWVDYLEAVADEPDLEIDRERAAPYTLVINATARAFRVATEEMLETEPSEAVRALAEAILDEGFRGFDEAADT